MIDPNWDPYQQLIDIKIDLSVMNENFAALVDAHNRMNRLVANQTKEQLKQLKYIQQQQQLIAELTHEIDLLKASK